MGKILKTMKSIIIISICLAVFWGIVSLAVYIFKTVQSVEIRESGNGWIKLEGEPIKTTDLQFQEICKQMEEKLQGNTLHIDSVLLSPQEYNIWEELGELAQLQKESLLIQGGSTLSDIQSQLLYEKLMYCYDMYQRNKNLPDYAMLFSEITGFLNTIPEIFYTCQFASTEEIEAYFSYLKQVPKLLEMFQERIKQQETLGIKYHKEIVQKQQEICQELYSEESIFLIHFQDKITKLDFLTDREKERYMKQNQNIVENDLAPVLQQIEADLQTLETEEDYKGLCNYVMGTQYFDYLLEVNTGSGMNAEEMFQYLEEKRLLLMEQVKEQRAGLKNTTLESNTLEEMIENLYQNTKQQYPEIEEVSWQLCYIPEFLEDKPYSAFFTKGLGKKGNYIYVNHTLEQGSALTLYQTLAHETFPGHMYAYSLEKKVNYPLLEDLVKCSGYNEGWAIAAEFAAGEWLPEEQQQEYFYIVSQKLLDEIFMCQADIGIHAFGWNIENLKELMQEVYGQKNQKVAEDVLKLLASNAGAYESYVVGYYQFLELKEYSCEELGMAENEFYQAYLQAGQMPFYILKKYMKQIV